MLLAPSPTMSLVLKLDANRVRKERKRAKDREYQRKRRADRKARRLLAPPTCRSCGATLPDPKRQVALHPDRKSGRVKTEPCCPFCANMVWRTKLWWMIRTPRFQPPGEEVLHVA